MHDLASIRRDPASFDHGLSRRCGEPTAERIVALDARRRELQTSAQEAQARRNEASKAIGLAMRDGNTAVADSLKREVAELKHTLPRMEQDEQRLGDELGALLAALPNIPADDVPEGADDSANVELARWGTPREFAFQPKEHADLGPPLGLDFETGAAMSGARFTFLRGQMARMHRALGQFMLDRQVDRHGYTECAPPLLVRDEALFGTGQLPKFAEDLFATSIKADIIDWVREHMHMRITGDFNDAEEVAKLRDFLEQLTKNVPDKSERRWLIPTAEVSLTNSVREQILDHGALPLRLTALTPCFRSEAGAAGRDTRGFIRQHQFEKVELVSVVRPEDSEAEHERMTQAAEDILQALGLPYRRMLLCAGDMGFTARKTYDLEVWLPGQGTYREISSCSNCGDFQARRMNARYRPEGEKKTAFVHTLNGSGLAVGRTLVAVLENYQQEDGTVAVPEVLMPYMGGLTRLAPNPEP